MIKGVQLHPDMKDQDIINLKKGQKIMTDMLRQFDKICRKHNIRYIIFAGTLLGSHFYKGWVPWDGDIDVLVYAKDYDKLKKALIEELPSDYWFQDPLNDKHYKEPYGIAKIRYLYAYYENCEMYGWHGGLQLDIFGFGFNNKNEFITTTSDHNEVFMKEKMSKEDVFPLKEIKFEDIQVTTLSNYKKYLNIRYPGCKKLIPIENRFPHEGKIIFGISDFHKNKYPELYLEDKLK